MISQHDIVRIAAHVICHPRTVTRVYQGKNVNPYSRRRVVEGALALNLPPPPGPSMGSSPPSPVPSPTRSSAA